ncbi:MAG: hypothetical protein KGJ86_07510, partial [Chloroflexota bacterium]|nr:hypothetical protein [Chloroflexota bacterium]
YNVVGDFQEPKEELNLARIQPLTKDEVSPDVRERLERSESFFGEPLVSTGVQAHCPPIMAASQELAAAPAKSGLLPPLIRSLVCLRAAQMAGCPF